MLCRWVDFNLSSSIPCVQHSYHDDYDCCLVPLLLTTTLLLSGFNGNFYQADLFFVMMMSCSTCLLLCYLCTNVMNVKVKLTLFEIFPLDSAVFLSPLFLYPRIVYSKLSIICFWCWASVSIDVLAGDVSLLFEHC